MFSQLELIGLCDGAANCAPAPARECQHCGKRTQGKGAAPSPGQTSRKGAAGRVEGDRRAPGQRSRDVRWSHASL